MSQAQAAAGIDRLPWLPDEPRPRPQKKRRDDGSSFILWALAAMLVVAALSYWMGARSWQPRSQGTEAGPPATSVPLPQARIGEPDQAQPQVAIEPAPEVSPTTVRELPIPTPRVQKRRVQRTGVLKREMPPTAELERTVSEQKEAAGKARSVAASPPKAAANPDARPLTAWPATKSQGAKGRIVRIGAFGSRQQAKLGWRRMVKAYPAVAHLKATVVGDHNSRGRHFYRFQIGTTSQAHSEVLCQRMEKIRFSCAVVGLPQDPAGIER